MDHYFLGMDAGSTYLKAALIKDEEIISTAVLPTGIDCEKTAETLMNHICTEASINQSQIKAITAAGYSRRNIEVADSTISEITDPWQTV
ncbi:hypothetical protein [Clostridium sp. JN-1]|uniref:hypothetical protein n=1 Tax=Clostridium sp. JN-1 TaxID=2483110 RepID=UPI001FAA02EE|nr:hypothetical protein [Clostridium sp. JN-1]